MLDLIDFLLPLELPNEVLSEEEKELISNEMFE
jgi:hypothetical protein